MQNFEYYNPVKVVFGASNIEKIGKLCSGIGKNALLVSYEYVEYMRTTITDIETSLRDCGIAVTECFCEACPEQEAHLLLQALAAGREYEALVLLTGLEGPKKGRERYGKVLEAAGRLARRSLTEHTYGMSPERTVALTQLLDRARERAASNAGLSLVSAGLCAAAAAL